MRSAAAIRSSDSTMASIPPSANACCARTCDPWLIQAIAFSGPTNLGRRTVPPKPGRMPSFTSGNPTTAASNARRKSVASANSKPPPKATPLIAATVGIERSSTALKTSLARPIHVRIASGPVANKSVNSVMSAPTIKVDFALEKITPRASLSPIAATASPSSFSVNWSNLLTDEPSRSKISWAIPEGSNEALIAWPENSIRSSLE